MPLRRWRYLSGAIARAHATTGSRYGGNVGQMGMEARHKRCLGQARSFGRGPAVRAMAFVGFASSTCASYAQNRTGYIHGADTDSGRANIAGTSNRVVNQATGAPTDAATNLVHYCQVSESPDGQYGVRITAPDVRIFVRTLEPFGRAVRRRKRQNELGRDHWKVTLIRNPVDLTDAGPIWPAVQFSPFFGTASRFRLILRGGIR
jgi:hypothetical protein